MTSSYAQRHMSHSHVIILANAKFIYILYTYGNFLFAFHLYQNIIKSVHYSKYVDKEVLF